jgi:hypothetical protein
MRILIVEDETAAYENLADMLVTIDPTLEIFRVNNNDLPLIKTIGNTSK